MKEENNGTQTFETEGKFERDIFKQFYYWGFFLFPPNKHQMFEPSLMLIKDYLKIKFK